MIYDVRKAREKLIKEFIELDDMGLEGQAMKELKDMIRELDLDILEMEGN